jgi:DNA polymerase-3 subunit delta'
MLIGHSEQQQDFKKLAEENRLAHGYIFFGPRRVGKATFARAMASYLETKKFDWGREAQPILGDLLHMAPPPEDRKIGIGQVREIKRYLLQAPNRSSRRTVVIDGAEFLTPEAENALLKTTEEPYPRALIILIVDDPERLLPTLRSRLQKVFFGLVPERDIEGWLVKDGGLERSAAHNFAAKAHGVPGLAWAYAHDERFKAAGEMAKAFLRARGYALNGFLKELVDGEAFHLDEFLEILTIEIFAERASAERQPALWHALMELRRNENYLNLNPRLQLTALAKHL